MDALYRRAATGVPTPARGLERSREQATVVELAKRSSRRPGPAVLLGVLFASIYLLTMGGHLDSPDEDLMFQVTRNLAERGTASVDASVGFENLALPGVDGRSYTHYGLVSSVLSVPFYKLGQAAAAALPPRYSEVVIRFAVGLRDPLISAGACALFYLLAVELGYEVTVAVLLTLAFGLATLFWPFSKYSFTEPVTGFWLMFTILAAMRAVRSNYPVRWSVLSGIALGMAVGAKITAALVAPVLVAYLALAGSCLPMTRVRRVLPFLLILLVPALGLALLNTARFGNPLDTGYFLQGYMWHPVGIAGLLVSPAKSLFLYAPVALLGLIGFKFLAARLPWESALLFWAVAVHVFVYGGFVLWWSGDAAWGPRYLVPVTAFIVLPAGALLTWTRGATRRLAWGAFGVLSAAGVLVNLGGVLVDQRVSFIHFGGLGPTDDQRWDPALSPILIHWNEIEKRTSNLVQWWAQPVSLVSGTYGKEAVDPVDAAEASRSAIFPRWTSGSAMFELKNHRQPVQLMLEYLDNRPESLGEAAVQIAVNGVVVPETAITRTHSTVALPDKRFPWFVEARLDDLVTGRDVSQIEIRSQTWQPARDAPPTPDVRELGVQIWDLQFHSNGRELALGEALFSPMPVIDARPWSYELLTWFYTPPWHVADVWLWYLYLSGLPPWLLLLAVLPLAGLVWSTVRLSRYLRA